MKKAKRKGIQRASRSKRLRKRASINLNKQGLRLSTRIVFDSTPYMPLKSHPTNKG